MLSPWKNMGDGLRDQDRKELCFCDLLSSVSLSGLICMLSQGKKARKNLNFKSQRSVKYRERRLKPRWGRAGRCSVRMSQGLSASQELPAPRQLLGARKEIGFMLLWCFSEHPFGGTQVQLLGLSCLPASILVFVNS